MSEGNDGPGGGVDDGLTKVKTPDTTTTDVPKVNADGSPAPTGDGVQDALAKQNWIAQQGLDQQKKYDTGLLDLAKQNQLDQENAYSDSLAASKAAALEQHNTNAAMLANAQSQAAGAAAAASAQLSIAQASFKMQEQQMNKLNAKAPDIASITSAASQQMRTGISSTMLTGPGGIDTGKLLLGGSAVLGS